MNVLFSNKKIIAITLATLLSPQAIAIGAASTYHDDFRTGLKIDTQPIVASRSLLVGESLSRQFLANNMQRYGLETNFEDLVFYKQKSSLLGKHYYYQQYLNGVPVDQAEIIVSVSKQNQVMRVFNNTYPVPKSFTHKRNYLINAENATETVWDFLQVSGTLRALPLTKLTYINIGTNFKLTYKINMTVNQPFGDWEFFIDAVTGKIINARRIDLPIAKNANENSQLGKWHAFAKNSAHKNYAQALAEFKKSNSQTSRKQFSKVDATGRVFDPDPVTTLSDDTLEDTSAASRFDAAYFDRTLRDVTLNNGTYSLIGPWVTIADFDPPTMAPSTTSDGIWSAKRGDNSFNDAMTYFHIDQNQRYIQSLGFTGASGVQEVSISVDTDGANGDDNSYFAPGGNQIAFGHGCVDDNEDIDVILHEYGHALNFSINNNFSGGDTGAMGEGFGDYWAASYSYSTPNGRSFHPERAFSWDGHNACWNGRLLDQTNFRYDPLLSYDAHAVVGGVLGDELWSTPITQSLIQLMDAGVAREEVDQIILESQFGLGGGLKMPDMAAAIVSTAVTLFPNGNHSSIFDSNFKLMDILSSSLGFEQLAIINAGSDMIAAPGETVLFNVTLSNIGGTTLSNISTVLTTTTPNISVDSANAIYPDIPAAQSANNVEPYQITIPASHVCGDNIELSLATNYFDGSDQTGNLEFILPVGVGDEVSQSSSPSIAIPDADPNGVTDEVILSNAVASSSISIDINISHTFRGDLSLQLISPAGTSVFIQTASNDSSADIIGNYPNDFTPSNSLSVFDNENHNGTWRLNVVDTAAQDLGTLNSWKVISTAPISCGGNSNSAPIASVANANIEVVTGNQVSLDASMSSDPDGDALTYLWVQTSGDAITLTNPSNSIASFMANTVGVFAFEVTVSDTSGETDTQTVTVNVAQANRAPMAVTGAAMSVAEGMNVNLDGSASSDADGDDLSFSWVQTGGTNVTLTNANSIQASFTAPQVMASSSLEFSLTVTDPSGASDTANITITVNDSPVVDDNNGSVDNSGGGGGLFWLILLLSPFIKRHR